MGQLQYLKMPFIIVYQNNAPKLSKDELMKIHNYSKMSNNDDITDNMSANRNTSITDNAQK